MMFAIGFLPSMPRIPFFILASILLVVWRSTRTVDEAEPEEGEDVDVSDEPFKEDHPLNPRNPYSASKAGGEYLARSYFITYGFPVIVTRGANNIGPYQYPEKVVPLFVTNAIDDIPLPLYGDGLQVRDYHYVLDHCEGIDLVLHAHPLGGHLDGVPAGDLECEGRGAGPVVVDAEGRDTPLTAMSAGPGEELAPGPRAATSTSSSIRIPPKSRYFSSSS